MQIFQIGVTTVGNGEAPVFWPDIDVYFRQDIELALRMLRELRSAGVSAIKGAVLHNAEICLTDQIDTEYFVANYGAVRENYRSIIERHVVSLSDLKAIYGRVRDFNIDLILSIYDEDGLELALQLGAAAIKIPSSNIVHAPLIRAAGSTGIPLVIDTGRSHLHEIDRAIAWARAAGAQNILVQHSPPGPPAEPQEFNLAMMSELGQRYRAPCGLSDHYSGTEVMFLAAALGASVIEKGVCADGTQPDIDIAHALPVSRVGTVLEQLAFAHATIGRKVRKLPDDYQRPRDRMGLVARFDLDVGTVLTESNVRFAFPTIGLPVESWDDVIGRRLMKAVSAGRPITADDLQTSA